MNTSKRTRRQPRLEILESKTLLSSVHDAIAVVPARAWIDARRAVTSEIDLSGTIKGSYTGKTLADGGKNYQFFGSGNVSPLNKADLTGHVRIPGLAPTPVSGGTSNQPIIFVAKGQMFLADTGGTVTVTATAPANNNLKLPDTLSYKITNASGRYKGDGGSGELVVVLDATRTTTNPKTGLPVEHGTFTAVFVPSSSTSSGSSS
jgi:hypothetical protein